MASARPRGGSLIASRRNPRNATSACRRAPVALREGGARQRMGQGDAGFAQIGNGP
jgi:hypothetical protein